VKTLTACLSDIVPFMAVLGLATVAFGLTFHLQMGVMPDHGSASQNHARQWLLESLWDSLMMAVLGDNGGLGVEHSSTKGLIVCFLLLTLIVNVIMMNVLIAIVSQTQERIKERKDAEYATFWAETLHGVDAW
jgi:hypothetical protein